MGVSVQILTAIYSSSFRRVFDGFALGKTRAGHVKGFASRGLVGLF